MGCCLRACLVARVSEVRYVPPCCCALFVKGQVSQCRTARATSAPSLTLAVSRDPQTRTQTSSQTSKKEQTYLNSKCKADARTLIHTSRPIGMGDFEYSDGDENGDYIFSWMSTTTIVISKSASVNYASLRWDSSDSGPTSWLHHSWPLR